MLTSIMVVSSWMSDEVVSFKLGLCIDWYVFCYLQILFGAALDDLKLHSHGHKIAKTGAVIS